MIKVTSTSIPIVNSIEEYILKIFHHEAYILKICYYSQQDRAPRGIQNDIKIFWWYNGSKIRKIDFNIFIMVNIQKCMGKGFVFKNLLIIKLDRNLFKKTKMYNSSKSRKQYHNILEMFCI